MQPISIGMELTVLLLLRAQPIHLLMIVNIYAVLALVAVLVLLARKHAIAVPQIALVKQDLQFVMVVLMIPVNTSM